MVWGLWHLSHPWATQMETAVHDGLAFCRRFRLDVCRGARLKEEHVAGEAWVQDWSRASLARGPSTSHRWARDQRTE